MIDVNWKHARKLLIAVQVVLNLAQRSALAAKELQIPTELSEGAAIAWTHAHYYLGGSPKLLCMFLDDLGLTRGAVQGAHATPSMCHLPLQGLVLLMYERSCLYVFSLSAEGALRCDGHCVLCISLPHACMLNLRGNLWCRLGQEHLAAQHPQSGGRAGALGRRGSRQVLG